MTPDNVRQLCLKARQAIEKRDWSGAKQAYQQALGLRSNLPDIHYGLGTVHFHLRELSSAVHHFREVVRLDPLCARAFINLGVVLNLLEQPEDAIAALRRGIQLDPQCFEAFYNLGLLYRCTKQMDLAIESFQEVLRLNPRMADACLNLGNLYLEKEQYNRARKQFEQALQLKPGWDRAVEGLRAVQEMAKAVKPEPVVKPAPPPPAPPAVPQSGPAAKPNFDLDRTADPVVYQTLLATLHNATVVSEESGRILKMILSEEIEPAIKELSSCLLNAKIPLIELDLCMRRFENALEHFHVAENALKANMDRLGELNEVFPFF